MPFEIGRGKTGGRQAGTPNRATAEFKEFWQQFFESHEYRENLKERVKAGKADHMEKYAAELLHGRPRQEFNVSADKTVNVIVRREADPPKLLTAAEGSEQALLTDTEGNGE